MNLQTLGLIFVYSCLATGVLFFAHYNYIWLALAAIMIPVGLSWRSAGGGWTAAFTVVPELIIGICIVTLIGMTRQPGGSLIFPAETQIFLAILYGIFIIWRRLVKKSQTHYLALAALSQFSATIVIFLAATYLQWSSLLVVASIWVASYLVGRWFFISQNETAGNILATTWALVAAQTAWVFYLWLVNYGLGKYFIIPQAAIVIVGVGYCFVSIYTAHIQKSLSRRRLIEYLVIAGIMLAIVIGGTRWNVAV